jgi:hypothetical protein
LLRILIYTHTLRRLLAPRIDRWIQDGVFQIQRKAYEAQELVTWERPDKEIPITDGKGLLLPQLARHATLPATANIICKCVSQQSSGNESAVESDKTPSLRHADLEDQHQSRLEQEEGVKITQGSAVAPNGIGP